MTNYRHEWKHEISVSDAVSVRQRMRAVAREDPHGIDGKYEITSLYFDNLRDKALREKTDGVNMREKFRIRCYNQDMSFVRLEKKSKCNGLTAKESVILSVEETRKILVGEYGPTADNDGSLLTELYCKMKTEGLRPRTIVEYTREAFLYGAGNVRVTLDYNIRTGLQGTDFLNPDRVMIPAGEPVIIMEVKWDAFLPDIIRDALQLKGRRAGAFSKYAVCRIYG